jgi:hypothetical protein
MANLTGDFDVIAQFAVPAVNRILAAMHRVERFPHSMAMRVDDTAQTGHDIRWPTLVGIVDAFGDATSDHASIRNPGLADLVNLGIGSGGGRGSVLDGIANIDVSDIQVEPIQPSQLKGRAQVQLSPPTIEINDTSGTKLTVRMGMMSRYLPDPGTPQVAQFVRGDLRITAPVNQVASQVANVISIDVKASSAIINFTPHWSSSPISPQDLAGVTQLIRNSLKTSFLPSNATLPSNIGHIQFKTIGGPQTAVAVLLDVDGPAGNPASANQVFLSGSDGFAFGIGADYVREAFQPTLDKILEQQLEPVKFDIDGWVHTWHITYTVTLNSATVHLENGKIVLTFKGHAHTGTSWLPNFNFTAKQDITIAVSGPNAEIELGNMTIDTSSNIVNLFKSGAIASMRNTRDRAMAESGVKAKVSKMLSAEENLGGFLRSLLTPAVATQPVAPLEFSLAYASAEIRTTGIVLHGTVGVPAWPPPRVEYEVITAAPGSGLGGVVLPDVAVGDGPDYSALKSWIPGGTIQRYEWHKLGSQGYTDDNRFVLLDEGPPATMGNGASARLVAGYAPMCLTIRGTRLTADGAVSNEPVGATVCGYRSFPLPGDFGVLTEGALLTIALARRGDNGLVDIVGHASPMAPPKKDAGTNLIVHFADESSHDHLESLTSALAESGRADAAAAILVVATGSQLSRLPYSESFTYAEDDGGLRRRYGLKSAGAATVVVGADGKVAWQSDGPVSSREVSTILGKVLKKTARSKATMLTANVRIGQPPPNFLFEHAPGQQLTLRKTRGRRVRIVFFRRSSQPSVEAVTRAARSDPSSIVLAVTRDETDRTDDLASVILVHDPAGRIESAYGVTMWPTVVSLDESGIVRSVDYGLLSNGEKSRG